MAAGVAVPVIVTFSEKYLNLKVPTRLSTNDDNELKTVL